MIEDLQEIFVTILEVDPQELTDEFGPDDAMLWDSMNNLRLITAIEEQFKIKRFGK
jgi:acyl carrier protein